MRCDKCEVDHESVDDKVLIRIAREQHHREGEIEVDEEAEVGRGDDCGAYIQAWVWVGFDDLS